MILITGSNHSDRERLMYNLYKPGRFECITCEHIKNNQLVLYITDLKFNMENFAYSISEYRKIILIIDDTTDQCMKRFLESKKPRNIVGWILIKNQIRYFCPKCRLFSVDITNKNDKLLCAVCNRKFNRDNYDSPLTKQKGYDMCFNCFSKTENDGNDWWCKNKNCSEFDIKRHITCSLGHDKLLELIDKHAFYKGFIIQLKRIDYIDIKLKF